MKPLKCIFGRHAWGMTEEKDNDIHVIRVFKYCIKCHKKELQCSHLVFEKEHPLYDITEFICVKCGKYNLNNSSSFWF